MKKRNMRALSVLLALLMLLSLLPTAAFAAVGDERFVEDDPTEALEPAPAPAGEDTVPVEEDTTPVELMAADATVSTYDYTGTVTADAPSKQADSGANSPEAALDGNEGTWYHSNWGRGSGPTDLINDPDNRYIQLDLTETIQLDGLRYLSRTAETDPADFGNGVITEYDIRVSTDGTNFTSAATGSWEAGATAWRVAVFPAAVSARYVRLYGVRTYGNGEGLATPNLKDVNKYISAAEIRLLTGVPDSWRPGGTPDGNLCRVLSGVNISDSSGKETNDFPEAKAIDGDMSTRWSSANSTATQYIVIDLGSENSVSLMKLYWQRQNVTAYTIQLSTDNSTWTTVHTFEDSNYNALNQVISFEPTQARYVKLNCIGHDDRGASGYHNISLWEIEVYRDRDAIPPLTLSGMADELVPVYVAAQGNTPAHIEYDLSGVNVPEGYSIQSIDANLEQVVGPDGTVYTPLVDTRVEMAITVTDGTNTATTSGGGVKTITIPGEHSGNEGNAKPGVIPEIMEWYSSTAQSGKTFTLTENSRVIHRYGGGTGGFDNVANELTADVEDLFGLTLSHVHDLTTYEAISNGLRAGDIVIYNVLPNGTADNLGKVKGFDNETYRIEITDHVTIFATDATGAYWATRTLLQALKLSEAAGGGLTVPQGTARDYPEFRARGLVLDVGRKAVSMDMLRTIAKNLAWYKFNDFHVHLNDNLIWLEDYYNAGENYDNDTAWERINDSAYAAFRLESDVTPEEGGKPLAAKDYHYTKAEFRSFIADSAKLGINVVPEIDVPAHAKAIADSFPSIRLRGNEGHSLNCHLDLSPEKYDQTLAVVKRIFDDYLDENGSFLGAPVVDFGSDEYLKTSLYSQFQKFTRDMIVYLKEKGATPRLWGSMGNNPGVAAEVADGVQMNIWAPGTSSPSADPLTMYNAGFDLLNVVGGAMYMVPSGNGSVGGYADHLNLGYIYSSWTPNAMGPGFAAGSSQILGGCFAIWQDNIDTHASGIDEYDTFDRIFESLPVVGVKLWGEGAARDRDLEELQADAEKLGYAPTTNPSGKVDYTGDAYCAYNFTQGGSDTSGNGRDLTPKGSATIQNGLLSLSEGTSYAELGLDRLGWGNQITFKVMKLPSTGTEEILFESEAAYGDYAIKALPGSDADHWRLGFSRELYDYEFPVDLPVSEWVLLTLTNTQERTSLMVDGDPPVNAVGKFVSDENSNTTFRGKTGIQVSSLYFPLARIGSKTNAFVGYLDELTIAPASALQYAQPRALTASAPSEANSGSDGPATNVVDGNPNTYWHSRYDGCKNGKGEVSLTPQTKYIEVALPADATVTGLRHLRRPSGSDTGDNGTVHAADIKVSTATTVTEGSDTGFTKVASVTGWGTANTYDEVIFDQPQENVRFVRLYGTTTQGAFMSAAEVEPIYTIPLTRENTTLALLAGSENWKVSERPHLTVRRAVAADPTEFLFLAEGTDYDLTYSDAGPGEECTITITGKGYYSGTLTTTYTVPGTLVKTDLSGATVTFAEAGYPLEDGKAEPKPEVKLGDKVLLEGMDYTLTYANNTAVGTGTVTVTGKGRYEGTVTAQFTVTAPIVRVDLSGAVITLPQANFSYTGEAITPVPRVTLNGTELTRDEDYTVAYSRNTNIGTATVTVTGIEPYYGSVSAQFRIIDPNSAKDLSNRAKTTVTFAQSSYELANGKSEPEPIVRFENKRLIANRDYTVSYQNNTAPGTGVVVIQGIGEYFGRYSATFVISGGQSGQDPKPDDNPGNTPSGGGGGGSVGGGKVTIEEQADGATVKKTTDAAGVITTGTTYPDGTDVSGTIGVDGLVTAVVTVPDSVEEVTVTIPTRTAPTTGQVAVIFHEDGTKEIVKNSLPTEDGVQVTLADDAILQVVDNTKFFVDVPDNYWASDAVTFTTSREIFNGTGNNTFTPAGAMSRAMVCTVLANLEGEETSGGATWYEKGVAWAVSQKISDGTNPNQSVTREQLVSMIYRYCGAPKTSTNQLYGYRDGGKVSAWAWDAMGWAIENGIILGKSGGALDPLGGATRAEVAVVFQRLIEKGLI